MADRYSEAVAKDTAKNPGSSVTIGTTSATLVSSYGARTGVYITNTHASNTLTLSLGGTAVANEGIRLTAGQAVYIDDYTGQINAIASGAGTTVGVAEV